MHCWRSWLEQWERGQWYDLDIHHADVDDHVDYEQKHDDDHGNEHDDHDHDHEYDDGHELNGWKAS